MENLGQFQPVVLIDQVSDKEFYIGTSNGGKIGSAAIWQIKHIIQTGTVWDTQYPTGDSSFSYAWTNRTGYTYA